MTSMFRGRTLNINTMMYEYKDGSGFPIPAEVAQELADAVALNKPASAINLISWKPNDSTN